MVYEILATTPFGKEKKGEVGIERMVDEGAYSGAFPLHDVSKLKNSMIEGQKIGQNWSKHDVSENCKTSSQKAHKTTHKIGPMLPKTLSKSFPINEKNIE